MVFCVAKARSWLAAECPPVNGAGKLELGFAISAKLGTHRTHLSLEQASPVSPEGHSGSMISA